MSSHMRDFFNNFSYSFASNIVAMIIRFVYVLLLPKIMGVNEFAYWQLYFLYASLIHFLHLGLVDGIYLKYGGLYFAQLNKYKMRQQFYILTIMALTFSTIIMASMKMFVDDTNKIYIISIICIDIILMLPRTLLSILFQTTGLIKQFALAVLSESIIGFVLVAILLSIGLNGYQNIILADMIARIGSLMISIYFAREIILGFVRLTPKSIKDAFANISIGFNILFSNLSGLLILGFVKIVIEQNWNIIVFGKVALALSITNMSLSAMSTSAIVLFPILKRVNDNLIKHLFSSIRILINVFFLGVLCFYYPVSIVFNIWIPQYNESLLYVAILFPLCIFEGRWMMLCNTYLKALRYEKKIFQINLYSITVSVALTLFMVVIMKNLLFTILSILIVFMFRSIVAELLLCSVYFLNHSKLIIIDIFMTIIFIIANYFIQGILGFTLYLIVYGIYLRINKSLILSSIENIRNI